MVVSWEGLSYGVEVLGDDAIVDEEPGLVGDEWVMMGWLGSVGLNGGEEWTSKGSIDEVEGNNGELKVMDTRSESLGVVAILMDDCGDFKMYSSIDLLAC